MGSRLDIGGHLEEAMQEQDGSVDGVTRLMTIQDVAAYLQLSKAKIYRMARSREIPAIRIGKSWRFRRQSIEDWLHRSNASEAHG